MQATSVVLWIQLSFPVALVPVGLPVVPDPVVEVQFVQLLPLDAPVAVVPVHAYDVAPATTKVSCILGAAIVPNKAVPDATICRPATLRTGDDVSARRVKAEVVLSDNMALKFLPDTKVAALVVQSVSALARLPKALPVYVVLVKNMI